MPPGAPARHRAPRHATRPPEPPTTKSFPPPPSHPVYAPPPDSQLGYAPPPDSEFGYAPPPDSEFGYAPPPDSEFGYGPPPDSHPGYGPPTDSQPGYGPHPGGRSGYGPPPGSGPPRRARLSRRVRYLLCSLLTLPLLAATGLYLTRASAPAPASATGKLTAAPRTSSSCDPSAAGSCAGQPFYAGVASVPASLSPSSARTKHRQPRSTPSASRSASASAPANPTSPTAAASATSPAGTSSGSAAAQVLALINQARSEAGLPALTITSGLDASASAHNATMAGGCGLSHQCPGEPDLGARETAAGVHWTAAGENIGEGGPVASSSAAIAQMAVGLTRAMLNEKPPDDGHRKNILSSSFTHIGIAVFRDSSGTVWLTQDFSN